MKCSPHLSLIAAMVISSLAPILTFNWKLPLSDEVDVVFRTKNETKTTTGVGASSGGNGDDPPARALLRQPSVAAAPAVLNHVKAGAAACLLIKDENHRLDEWIAYHYHALPLRHLVVAVDSTSVTSPSSILDRWRTTAGMTDIVEWRDADYMYAPMMEEHEPLLFRQRFFIPACAAYHRAKRRSWVFLHDVDEYVSFNSLASDELHLLDEMQRRGGGRTRSNLVHEKEGEESRDLNSVALRNQRIMARGRLPAIGNATVLDFLNESRDGALWRNDTCITIPRLFFSAVESGQEEISGAHADQLGFNATDFNTLRFFHHAEKGAFKLNRWGKVAIDVSRIHMQMFLGNIIQNPHKPFDVCKSPVAPYETSFLRCNHYMSSWEAYSFKNDSRRTRDEYDKVASISSGTTYDMQPWLSSFVRAVGNESAHYLLRDVGRFEEHKLPHGGDRVN